MLREIAEEYPVPFDQEKLFQRSYAKFQGTEELPGVKRPLWRRTAFRALTAAACLILTVGLGVGVWSKQQRIEPIPPQETTAASTQTSASAEAQTEAVTRTQTTAKQSETTRTSSESTACRTEGTESISAAARSTAISTAPTTPAQTEPARTAPVTAAQTAAAAVTAAAPAVRDTAPSYQTAAMKGTPTGTDTAETVPASQGTTVPNGSGTAALSETTAQPTTASFTQTTAKMTELPSNSTIVSWETYPYDNKKEELLMKAKTLKKMQAMINAAVSTAALVTSPALTTAAAENTTAAEPAAAPAATTTVDLTEPPTDAATQYGDVNLDQEISMIDLIQLQRFLLGTDEELGNWVNADLHEDGEIDVYDLALLKRQLLEQRSDLGGSLHVEVLDMMTAEPLEKATVSLIGLKENYAYSLAEWECTPDKAKDLTVRGLPTDPSYTYMIELSNLPAGYGGDFGNWGQQYFYSYEDGEKEKDVKLHVVPDNVERNVQIRSRDWSMELTEPFPGQRYYGLMCITDREGNPYYPSQYFDDFALPDGEYIAFMCPFEDRPVQLLTPDSEYLRYIHELYPDVTIADQSKGLAFTVKDGKPDRDLAFDFGPLDGTANQLTIKCVDAATDEPIPGLKIEMTANLKGGPKLVDSWTTDETGSRQIDDLHYTGLPAYRLQISNIPEGYRGPEEQDISFGVVDNCDQEIVLRYVRMAEEKNFSADVIKWEDKSVINDAATYELWHIAHEERGYLDSQNLPEFTLLFDSVKPGEMIALSDGDYFAVLHRNEYEKKGLSSITSTTYKGKKFFEENGLSYDEFQSDTAMIGITIKDGKPTRKAVFYLKDYDPADNEIPEAAYAEWDKMYEEYLHPDDEEKPAE